MEGKQKSLLGAYILWLFGGLAGFHHLYLGRDRHAFISWMSFGCYFGLGWLRDLWRLPEYVRDANNDREYLAQLTNQMRRQEKPPSGFVRYSGTIIIADILGYLTIGAIPVELLPDKTLPHLCAILAPFAVATGVHLVGNVGRHQGAFKWPLLGAYLTAPLYYFSKDSVFWTSLLATWFFNKFSKQWRRTPSPRRGILKRIITLSFCCLLYASLWTSWFYFNCQVHDQHEQEIKCRDAAKNFFNSPAWREFSRVCIDLWIYSQHHGFSGIWKEIIAAFDPTGEDNAIQVLNLTSNASQEEITARYKTLARQWHPDRHKSQEAKRAAQEQFIRIQQAYEILSRSKNQRRIKNKRYNGENPSGFEKKAHTSSSSSDTKGAKEEQVVRDEF